MKANRRLTLRREHLDDLTPAELARAGGGYELWVTMHNTCTHCGYTPLIAAVLKTG